MGKFLKLESPREEVEEDPLASVANLFDVSIVFIVGLMISLFSVYNMGGLIIGILDDSQAECNRCFFHYCLITFCEYTLPCSSTTRTK